MTADWRATLERVERAGFCECGCGRKTTIATRSRSDKGWVKGKPKRFIHGHQNRLTTPAWLEEDRGYRTPCWIWQRATNHGYGVTTSGGRMTRAHRVTYEQFVGPIPDGLQLDHLCRVRPCVNPDHLEPVTSAENTRRGSNAKLTHEDAATIRTSDESAPVLAERYSIHITHVYDIRKGKKWREAA